MESVLLDVAGQRRSPATMPGYHRDRPPRNKGEHYPADPPTVEEIVAVMRIVGDRADGHRLRALIVLLWRAGLRISEALTLQESDLDRSRGAVLVRHGKGGKRREVGMNRWAWDQLDPWLEIRRELPIGALLCVIHGPTAGRHWEASAARKQLHHAAAAAGVRRRFAPHQLRHARGRDGTRRRPARGDPATAGARQPRHHQHLPPGHRQQRDHHHRPRTTITDDLRHRRAPAEAVKGELRPGRRTSESRPDATPSAGEQRVRSYWLTRVLLWHAGKFGRMDR
jgi:integrase